MFAALADPKSTEYTNESIEVFIALAPIVYLSNGSSTFLNLMTKYGEFLVIELNLLGVHNILPGACSMNSIDRQVEKLVCKSFKEFCGSFLDLADADPSFDNVDRFPTFLEHVPAGAATRQFYHYRQYFIQSKTHPVFNMYDFGSSKNLQVYGSRTPPVYNFNNIRVPVKGFVGLEDRLGDPTDNSILQSKLLGHGVNYEQTLF